MVHMCGLSNEPRHGVGAGTLTEARQSPPAIGQPTGHRRTGADGEYSGGSNYSEPESTPSDP
eukprot:1192494-Prorocentrum_minimum.AAC.1